RLRLGGAQVANLLDRAGLHPVERGDGAETLSVEEDHDPGVQVGEGGVAALIEHPRAQRANDVVHAVLGRLRDLLTRYDVPIASRGGSLDAGRGTGRESEQRYRE